MFAANDFMATMGALGLNEDARLSVLVVEMMPQDEPPEEPLGKELGRQRILRCSELTPVPVIC
jgi:hypothetical protein